MDVSTQKNVIRKYTKHLLKWGISVVIFLAGFISSNYLLERKAYANFPHYQLTMSLAYLTLFRGGNYDQLEGLLESELQAGVAAGVKIKETIISDALVNLNENFDKKLLAAINYMESNLDTFSGYQFRLKTNSEFSNRVAKVKQELQSKHRGAQVSTPIK